LDAAASTLESRAQGNTKALWDGWEEKGLRAGGWGLGGGGPSPNGKKIFKPDHAAAFSALLFGLPAGRSKVSLEEAGWEGHLPLPLLSLALSSSILS